ncbi:MAG: endonuclease domain-containing protein [Candidatus Heimdallarchaeaceae archaeon]
MTQSWKVKYFRNRYRWPGLMITKAEMVLRFALEREKINFITQEPIRTENGLFIVDFVIGSDLIVEVDGGSHVGKTQLRKDRWKTLELTNAGYKVLRFTNREVMKKLDKVVETIKENMKK